MKKQVNITIKATMTEADGVKYYEIGTINKSKNGNRCVVLTSAKSEEPIYAQIQKISERAREAKHYTPYQLRKLTIIHNTKEAVQAKEIAKEEALEHEKEYKPGENAKKSKKRNTIQKA